MIAIKKIGIESIPVIFSLAHSIWPNTYKEILAPIQIDYMLQLLYSEASLKIQIEQKKHQFILAVKKNENVGFASYSVKSEEEKDIYRLHKIYIHPSLQGKGIGKLMIDYIVKDIKQAGALHLELNVNRYNKALQFYQKLGFVIIKEEDIDLGNSYFMNDYVLILKL